MFTLQRFSARIGALTVFLGSAFYADAGAAYLPEVGPVALRFFTPAKPSTNHFSSAEVSPPVTPPASTVAAPKSQPIAQTSVPASAGESAVKIQPELPPLLYGASSPSSEPPTQPEEVISPQMFLRYFNKSTNGPTSATVIPINPPAGSIPVEPAGFMPPKSTAPIPAKTVQNSGQ